MEPIDESLPSLAEQPSFFPLGYSAHNSSSASPTEGAQYAFTESANRYEPNSQLLGSRQSKNTSDSEVCFEGHSTGSPFTGYSHRRSSWWSKLFSSHKNTRGKKLSSLNFRSRRFHEEQRRWQYACLARLFIVFFLLLLFFGSWRSWEYFFPSEMRSSRDEEGYPASNRESERTSQLPPNRVGPLQSFTGMVDQGERRNADNHVKDSQSVERKNKSVSPSSKASHVSLLTPLPLWASYPSSARIRHLLRAVRRGRSTESTMTHLYASSGVNSNLAEPIAEEEKGVEMGSISFTWMAYWWWFAMHSNTKFRSNEHASLSPTLDHENESKGNSSAVFSFPFFTLPWRYRSSSDGNRYDLSSFLFPPSFYEEKEIQATLSEKAQTLLPAFHSLLLKKISQWSKEEREQTSSWNPLVEVVSSRSLIETSPNKSFALPLPSRRLLAFIPWESSVAEDLLVTSAPYHDRLLVYSVRPYAEGVLHYANPAESESETALHALHEEKSTPLGKGIENEGTLSSGNHSLTEELEFFTDEMRILKEHLQPTYNLASSFSDSGGKKASSVFRKKIAAQKFALTKLWVSPHLPSSSSSSRSSAPASPWIVSAIAADILGNGAVDVVVQSSDGHLYIIPDSHGLARKGYEEVKDMKKKIITGERKSEKGKKSEKREMSRVVLTATPRHSGGSPLSLRFKDPLQPMLTAASLSSPSSSALASGRRPADLLYVNDEGELLILTFHAIKVTTSPGEGNTNEYYYNATSIVPGVLPGHREVLPYSIVQADVNGDCAAELVYGIRDVDRKKIEVYAVLAPPLENEEEVLQQQQAYDKKGKENKSEKASNTVHGWQPQLTEEENRSSEKRGITGEEEKQETHASSSTALHREELLYPFPSSGGRYEVDPEETTPWRAVWLPFSPSYSSVSSRPTSAAHFSAVEVRHHLLLELDESDVRYGHFTFADVDGDGFVDLLIPYGKAEEAEEEVLNIMSLHSKESRKQEQKRKKSSSVKSAEGQSLSSSTSPATVRAKFASCSSIDGIRVFYNLAVGPASFSPLEHPKKEGRNEARRLPHQAGRTEVRGPSAACLPAYHGRLPPFESRSRRTRDASEPSADEREMKEKEDTVVVKNEYRSNEKKNNKPERKFVEGTRKIKLPLHGPRLKSSTLYPSEWRFGFHESMSAIMPLNAATCGLHRTTRSPSPTDVRFTSTYFSRENRKTTFSSFPSELDVIKRSFPRILLPQLLRTGDYNRDGQADVLLSSNVGPLLLTSIRRTGVLGRQRPPVFMRPQSTDSFCSKQTTGTEEWKEEEDDGKEWWKKLQNLILERSREGRSREKMEWVEEEDVAAYAASSLFTSDATWNALTEAFPFRCTPLDKKKATELLRFAEWEERMIHRLIVTKENEEGKSHSAEKSEFQEGDVGAEKVKSMKQYSSSWYEEDEPFGDKIEGEEKGRDAERQYESWKTLSSHLRWYRDATAFFRSGWKPGELYIGLTVLHSLLSNRTTQNIRENLSSLPPHSGYGMEEEGVSALLYADDITQKTKTKKILDDMWFGLYEPQEYQHEHYYLLLSAVSPLSTTRSSTSSSSSSSSSYQSWYGAPSVGLVHHLFWHNKYMQPQEAFVTQLPRSSGFAFSPFQVLVGLGETFSYAHHYMVGRRSFSYLSLHKAGGGNENSAFGGQKKEEEQSVNSPFGRISTSQGNREASGSFLSIPSSAVHLSTREWPIFLVPNSQVFSIVGISEVVESKKKKRQMFQLLRSTTKQKVRSFPEIEDSKNGNNISELLPFLSTPDVPEEWKVVLYMPVQKYRRRLLATLFVSLMLIGIPIIYFRWSEWRQDEVEWRNR